MDISIDQYLDEVTAEGRQVDVVAPIATAFPRIGDFLVAPSRVTCHQGAQSYPVIVLGARDDTVLYVDAATRQFGIAFQSAARQDHVFAGRQYPSLELAVAMFLGDRSALDPD